MLTPTGNSLRFGSVCSGIEAASVAFTPLGWTAAWLSEIEPFPCAVLADRYPGVPNLGDMTTIAARIKADETEAPDMLCGGTPCQAFSVAGLRRSLGDARGNLSLEFIRIADAIDRVRRAAGQPPAWILWENVPGVLNTSDNAFGAFLGGLCGCDSSLDAPAEGGRVRVWLLGRAELSLGGCWMPSFSDWPSDGSASLCSLSEVLQAGPVPTRYFLSPTACAGILRRAEKRGKELPPSLHQALRQVAGASSDVESHAGKTRSSPSTAPTSLPP